MTPRWIPAPIALAGLLAANAAVAAPQCSVPFGLRPAAPVMPRADQVRPDIPVTHYILALSWAPSWCRTGAGRRATERGGNAECSDPARGFVLHGFWPNGEGRQHPQYCAPAGPIDIATLRTAYCMTPSASLLQHEWGCARHLRLVAAGGLFCPRGVDLDRAQAAGCAGAGRTHAAGRAVARPVRAGQPGTAPRGGRGAARSQTAAAGGRSLLRPQLHADALRSVASAVRRDAIVARVSPMLTPY